MIGKWLRAHLMKLANRVRYPETQPEVAAGSEPAKPSGAPIRVLWGEPSEEDKPYE